MVDLIVLVVVGAGVLKDKSLVLLEFVRVLVPTQRNMVSQMGPKNRGKLKDLDDVYIPRRR